MEMLKMVEDVGVVVVLETMEMSVVDGVTRVVPIDEMEEESAMTDVIEVENVGKEVVELEDGMTMAEDDVVEKPRSSDASE